MGQNQSDNSAKPFGPDNPHPLSKMKTELVWEGKYDEYGNRREVDIAGLAMPMQRIETIDQPRSEAAAAGQLDLFNKKTKRLDDFRNRLIWGDNKLVMASLLQEFRGKVDLIYIDPPFDVGADFTMQVPIGDGGDAVQKDQSAMEMVAFRDMWGKGTDSYLHTMYERVLLMKELLSETGSLCVHCDWHASHLLKNILVEVYGRDNYRNEIVWWYYNKMQGNVGQFPANHDVILWFSKTANFRFAPIRELRDEPKQQQKRVWDPGTKSLKQARDEDGELIYYTEAERTIDDVWRVPYLMPADVTENWRYNTQKPIELVGRLIDALTGEDGLILDAFCGSGTALTAAEGARVRRTGNKKDFYTAPARRWIGIDLGRFAVHTSRKRLIELQRKLHAEDQPYRAFDVYNLGRYERQWWQKETLHGANEEHRRVVLEFFRSEILSPGSTPSPLLHGRKGNAFCHVDGIDSIFSREEATAVAKAVKAVGGRECYCLAWEFEMDLRLTTAALETELGVTLKLIQIPREIMEKNRKGPPPFLEVAVLEAQGVTREPEKKGDMPSVDVKLTRFLPSLAEVPGSELEAMKERAIKSGFDFIDFWAVDFDWKPGQPFNHHWQDYRTRKDRSLKTVSEAGYVYAKRGVHTVCVKVVDTFGCDTSITLEVKI